MTISYQEFFYHVSNAWWQLPEPLRSDVQVVLDPEHCKLHRVVMWDNRVFHDVMGWAHGFDVKTGRGLVFLCYQSTPNHLRNDAAHLRRVLVHEIEHAFNPDKEHSEHEYPKKEKIHEDLIY